MHGIKSIGSSQRFLIPNDRAFVGPPFGVTAFHDTADRAPAHNLTQRLRRSIRLGYIHSSAHTRLERQGMVTYLHPHPLMRQGASGASTPRKCAMAAASAVGPRTGSIYSSWECLDVRLQIGFGASRLLPTPWGSGPFSSPRHEAHWIVGCKRTA